MNYHASTYSHSLYLPLYERFLIEKLSLLANAVGLGQKTQLDSSHSCTQIWRVLVGKWDGYNRFHIQQTMKERVVLNFHKTLYALVPGNGFEWFVRVYVCVCVCFLSTSEIYELITTGDYHSANQVSQSANPTHHFCAELTKLLLPWKNEQFGKMLSSLGSDQPMRLSGKW